MYMGEFQVGSREHSVSLDDDFDLLAYLRTLVCYKWPILAFVAVSVVTAGIVSYAWWPPTYESLVVVSLPAADGKSGVGLSPQDYAGLASSPAVLALARDLQGSDETIASRSGGYDVQLDERSRLLTVSAAARTPEQAFQLANRWKAAFDIEIRELLQRQVERDKAAQRLEEEGLLRDLSEAEDALAAFDKEALLPLMEGRLSGMIQQLTGVSDGPGQPTGVQLGFENQIRHLVLVAIPRNEAKLAFLEEAIVEEPRTLGGTPEDLGSAENSSGDGITVNEVTILNPVYLQLSQELVDTRVTLVADRREASVLQEHIPSLMDEIEQLEKEIVDTVTQRGRLEPRVEEARALYGPAVSDLNAILEVERRLPELSGTDILQEPQTPETPVSPRKVYNIALTGTVAAFLAAIMAFFFDWYRRASVAAARNDRRGATAPSGTK